MNSVASVVDVPHIQFVAHINPDERDLPAIHNGIRRLLGAYAAAGESLTITGWITPTNGAGDEWTVEGVWTSTGDDLWTTVDPTDDDQRMFTVAIKDIIGIEI